MIQKLTKYIIIACIFLISITLSITVFSGAYVDLVNACVNAAKRIVFYFSGVFGGNFDAPPEIAPPITPPGDIDIIPTSPEYLGLRFEFWSNMLISGDFYAHSWRVLIFYGLRAMQIGMIIIPLIIALYYAVRAIYFHVNNRHGIDTIPLKFHKKISKTLYVPAKNTTAKVANEFSTKKWLKAILILIWALNFNIVSIILELFSFYIYFSITFNFIELYRELFVIIKRFKFLAIGSGVIIAILGIWIFNKWRYKHAVNKLESLEAYNQEILKLCDISTYKYGVMGAGKTLTMTDQALSIVINDLNEAEESKAVCRKMFPFFPWLLFELDIEKRQNNGEIKNFSHCLDYVDELQTEYDRTHKIFDYDCDNYGMHYYNGVVVNNIFDVLKDYSRLHRITSRYNSFIISNYAIREDRVPYTEGNTIKWDTSFFTFGRKPEDSFYSKNLPFDLLRMGKTVGNEPINKSFEFGIIVITEDDKEQQNAVETINDSPNSPYANPKNDRITLFEKFIRHPATIMGHCYAHLLKDGKRVMSINADTREISTVEEIQKPSKEKSALALFWLDKSLYSVWSKFFNKFEDKMRYLRGDNTLLLHFLKIIDTKLYNNYYRKKNRYGYRVVKIHSQKGTLDNEINVIKYYRCNAKIFADRYKTANREDFFYTRMRECGKGIDDLSEYESTAMTPEDYERQGSYAHLNMSKPDWREPYIEEERKKKAIAKAEAQAEAKRAINIDK